MLLFDLWNRVYGYPIEYIIEALAPTTELDFDRLPAEKQRIYRQIQAAHIHASPDGPWFFIIARSLAEIEIVPTAGHHRHGHAPAAGVRPAGGRGLDRADLLGEAGDRRHAGQPGGRRPAVHARGRHLLERPRRQPHRRRRVPADRRRQRLNGPPEPAQTANGQHYDLRVTNKFGVPVATLPGQIALQSVASRRPQPADTDGRRWRPSTAAIADGDAAGAVPVSPRADGRR